MRACVYVYMCVTLPSTEQFRVAIGDGRDVDRGMRPWFSA